MSFSEYQTYRLYDALIGLGLGLIALASVWLYGFVKSFQGRNDWKKIAKNFPPKASDEP